MRRFLLFTAALLFAATCLSGTVYAQTVLKLGETHPKGYVTELADEYFAQRVNELSKGRLKVEVYPGSQLGEEKAVIEQVQIGAVAFTRVSTAPMAGFNKQFGVFSLPYIFDSTDHMWAFLTSKYGRKLLEDLTKSKFVGLCYMDGGARSFYSTKPIKTFADLKGLKIRVQQNKINMEMISALGASATPMAYGQVFSSLQTGVIDGAENNYPSYFTSNHYQIAKFYMLDYHLRTPEVLVMSKAIYDKLPKNLQDIVRKAALEAEAKQKKDWASFEKECAEKVKAAGCTISSPPLKPFQDAVKPMIDSYKGEFGPALDAIANSRSAAKKKK